VRILPSGSTALLVEVDDLDQVLALYAALRESAPDGVVDLVPAARTVLIVTDPATTTLAAAEQAVRAIEPQPDLDSFTGEAVEIPVVYDGEDLAEVARSMGCDPAEVVRRHIEEEWTVAFCGFAPGFGYLAGSQFEWDTARRDSPRTEVPAGSVALAGEFSAVYPRVSPGGWQLIGRTDHPVFDLERDPPALLQPGRRVRFVDAGAENHPQEDEDG
jgi:KipI family sensor histidine kinase inhibitor